jgi:hypothetical protein
LQKNLFKVGNVGYLRRRRGQQFRDSTGEPVSLVRGDLFVTTPAILDREGKGGPVVEMEGHSEIDSSVQIGRRL